MKLLDYVIIAAVAVCFLLVLVFLNKKRKNGRCIGCSGSGSCNGCHAGDNERE